MSDKILDMSEFEKNRYKESLVKSNNKDQLATRLIQSQKIIEGLEERLQNENGELNDIIERLENDIWNLKDCSYNAVIHKKISDVEEENSNLTKTIKELEEKLDGSYVQRLERKLLELTMRS